MNHSLTAKEFRRLCQGVDASILSQAEILSPNMREEPLGIVTRRTFEMSFLRRGGDIGKPIRPARTAHLVSGGDPKPRPVALGGARDRRRGPFALHINPNAIETSGDKDAAGYVSRSR
jgi:hypothetical protein